MNANTTLAAVFLAGLASELDYMSTDDQAAALDRADYLNCCDQDEVPDAADFIATAVRAERNQ